MTTKEREFRDFVKSNFEDLLLIADVGWAWHIEYTFYDHDQQNGDGSETEFTITVIPENREITLLVFDRVRKYYHSNQLDKIIDGLCHEVGHVVIAPIDDLIAQPYKTEKEVEKATEATATKIGYYLRKLTYGDKNKWRKHKLQVSKGTKQGPNKKR